MRSKGKTPWLIRILSLFFALLFFYNANLAKFNKNDTNFTQLTALAEKVPVNVTYNQDKYFISGYEQTVNVELSSANKILLDKESNAETRSFSVVMDLTKYGEGTHEVPLEVSGLPSGMKAKISPNKLNVTVENKASNKFKVDPVIDPSIFANGYELDKAEVDPENVTLYGGEESIKKVARVIASVSEKSNVSGDFYEKIKPYAVDANNEPLNVRIEPESVRVDISLKQPTKKVKVKAVQTGTVPQGIKDYAFNMKQDEVEITGPKEILDEINLIELKIDTSNIKETIENAYPVVVPKDVSVSPETLTVQVVPKKENEKTAQLDSKLSTIQKKSDKIPVSIKK
ncbi:MAG: CdaR family protein [Vagococcus sp.]